jgi:hypothetical protein
MCFGDQATLPINRGSTWFFCYDFFQNYLCRFYFFNIELIENYNYNKAKSYGKSIVAFLIKHCGLLQCLSHSFFFL